MTLQSFDIRLMAVLVVGLSFGIGMALGYIWGRWRGQ